MFAMILRHHIGVVLLVALLTIEKALTIMVPTGKVGPITPRKIQPVAPVVNSHLNFRQSPAVYENVDEGPNPYQPPVYRYELYDFVRKYSRRTLIPREDQYYKPQARPTYNKWKYYYSPLQLL